MSSKNRMLRLVIVVVLAVLCVAVVWRTYTRQGKALTTPVVSTGPEMAESEPSTQATTSRAPSSQVSLAVREEVTQTSEQTGAEVFGDTLSYVKNPVHQGRAKLQEQMRNETIQDSFSRLVDNDNFAMLMPAMESRPFSPGFYPSDVRSVFMLARVRKIVADARQDRASASRFLQEQLSDLLEKFPAAYKKQKATEANSDGAMSSSGQLPEAAQYRVQAAAAVYALSEIGAADALPLLAKLSVRGTSGRDADGGGSCLVNRKFVLYAMHRLVTEMPEAGLSQEAKQAMADYAELAKQFQIPDTTVTDVAAWDARYDEADYRKTLPGHYVSTAGQPTVKMVEYPSLEGLEYQNVGSLLAGLRAFVQAAYPAK